ncbi:MAG: chromosomal replication initiator protein DnaA [Desulfovibrionaceae bacterium]|nr:chromosomal replication initiator protein DnaA [Desulfovibrionaceae bacterium]
MNATWSQILQQLRQSLPEGVVKVWLEPLSADVREAAGQPAAFADAAWELVLTAPNDFAAAWVRDRLSQPILQAAAGLCGSAPVLTLLSAAPRGGDGASAPDGNARAVLPRPLTLEELARSLPTKPAVLASRGQLALPLPHQPRPLALPGWKHSFDDFVVGPCNRLAHAAACTMLQNSASSQADILFLCSAPGLGKTHLAQAVGRALCQEADRRSVRVDYLTAEEFTTRFVQASRFGSMDEFKEHFRHLDMLLLEDVHFLRGKDKTQEELLSTIKALQDRGGRVVLTSSFAPRDLAGVDSQLVSRFCSGFVASMERPGRETRLDILLDKARRNAVILPDSVADMLAERVTGDVRLLESCVRNLALKARLLGCPVNEDMALEVIHSVASSHSELSLETVVELVCRSFQLSPALLASRSRRQDLVTARNTAFYLLRKHTDMTLEDIGRRFNRQHSTVLKGITGLEREMSRQSPLGRQIRHTVELIERHSARA